MSFATPVEIPIAPTEIPNSLNTPSMSLECTLSLCALRASTTSYYYGVLLGFARNYYIVTVQNGSHIHFETAAGSPYDVRVFIGSSRQNIYYSDFTTTDPAVISYLLPMIDLHYKSTWSTGFNILAQSQTSGALDFLRIPELYEHIKVSPGVIKNTNTVYPSNVKIVDSTVLLTNTQLSARYGTLAATLREMFSLYSATRQLFVFGNQFIGPRLNSNSNSNSNSNNLRVRTSTNNATNTNTISTGNKGMRDVSMSTYIDKCGNLTTSYTDGAIFFYDPINQLLDGVFTMSERQYDEFIACGNKCVPF